MSRQPDHVPPASVRRSTPPAPDVAPDVRRAEQVRALPRVARGALAGAVALAVVVATIAGIPRLAHPEPAAPGEAADPAAAAQGFLTAVAAGRAADAIAFMLVQPVNQTLLTDEVLVASKASVPITGITALARGNGTPGRTLVDVTYLLGGQAESDTYSIRQAGPFWYLDETLPTGPAYDAFPSGVTLSVNGVAVPSGYSPSNLPMFPGRYTFALGNDLLDVANADFLVPSLHAPVNTQAQTQLTADGRAKVLAAAEDTLAGCLREHSIRTSCGFGFSHGPWLAIDANGHRRTYTYADNQARWSLDPGGTNLATTQPGWRTCDVHGSFSRMLGVCQGDMYIMARMASGTTGGGTDTRISQLGGYVADISDPAHIRIAFVET